MFGKLVSELLYLLFCCLLGFVPATVLEQFPYLHYTEKIELINLTNVDFSLRKILRRFFCLIENLSAPESRVNKYTFECVTSKGKAHHSPGDFLISVSIFLSKPAEDQFGIGVLKYIIFFLSAEHLPPWPPRRAPN